MSETETWHADGPVVYAALGDERYEIVCYLMHETGRRPIEQAMQEEMALAALIARDHEDAVRLRAALERIASYTHTLAAIEARAALEPPPVHGETA